VCAGVPLSAPLQESNTWEGRENLKNTKKAIEEFEKEYQ